MRVLLLGLLPILSACSVDSIDHLLISEARAQSPMNDSTAEKYWGPLFPNGHAMNFSTDEDVILLVAGGTYTDERDAWCFPFESLVVIQAMTDTFGPARACVCFALEDEEAVFTMSSGDSCGNADDTSGSIAAGPTTTVLGPPCFTVNGRRDIKLDKAWWPDYDLGNVPPSRPGPPPGYSSGACTQTMDTARHPWAGGNKGAPCRAAADCVNSAGANGTCGGTFRDITCAYAYVEVAASEATQGSFEIER